MAPQEHPISCSVGTSTLTTTRLLQVYRNTVYGYPWYTDVRKTLGKQAVSLLASTDLAERLYPGRVESQRTLLILTGTSNSSHKARGVAKNATRPNRLCAAIFITLKSKVPAFRTAMETVKHQDAIAEKFRADSTVYSAQFLAARLLVVLAESHSLQIMRSDSLGAVWNHSSTTVVNNQTFQDWFINSCETTPLHISSLSWRLSQLRV